jgi:tRNA(fMet)-specific endonuclease VapC
MRYLLDTNIVSDLMRHPRGVVTERIRAVGESSVCTSVIVSAELRYGVRKKGSEALAARLDAIIAGLEVLPFESPADVLYGDLRVRLEGAGQPIGSNDLLIGAHALALDCILVTDNGRELGRIPELRCENWLR